MNYSWWPEVDVLNGRELARTTGDLENVLFENIADGLVNPDEELIDGSKLDYWRREGPY